MKSLMVRIGLLCLLLATAVPGVAREAEGLYQAEVPVKGQARDERLVVYPAAMAQVVVKLTGDRKAPELPRLAAMMASAQNWVQQFSYQTLELPSLKEQGYTHILSVQFDERAVNQALIAAAVPLWGRTRPDLLVWLAVEEASSRALVAANGTTEFGLSLESNTRRRGLPLILPMLDLDDQGRLGFGDVWGNFRQPIMEASKRYGANAVLVGRVNRLANGNWQGRWSLYQGEDVQHWVADGADPDTVVALAVDGVADRFAKRYAQLMTVGTANQVVVKVIDVATLAGYARAQQYLLSLDLITRIQVARVEGNELFFNLDVRGDVAGIDRAITLGGTLRRITATADDGATLVYQLLP